MPTSTQDPRKKVKLKRVVCSVFWNKESSYPLSRRNHSGKLLFTQVTMKEPLDGGCDAAVTLQQVHLGRIKEEPDSAQEYGQAQQPKTEESDLKISSVFSVTASLLAQQLSTGFQLSVPSHDPNISLSSVPAAAAQALCCGCKKTFYKGQTAYHKTGSAQLFCSIQCIGRYSSAVCQQLPPRRTCTNCSKDILNPEDVITMKFENSSPSKDFCSKSCLSSHKLKKKPVVTIYTNGISTKCSMCQKNADIRFEVKYKNVVHALCSDACFSKFHTTNNLTMKCCEHCGSYCYSTFGHSQTQKVFSSSVTAYKQNSAHKPPYAMGKSLRPSTEVIETTNYSGKTELFCSVNCLSAYRVKNVTSSGLQVLCHSCKTSAIPQYHVAMSNGTIYSFCSSSCVVSFQNIFNKPKETNSSAFPSHGQVVASSPLGSAVLAGKGDKACDNAPCSFSTPVTDPAAVALHTLTEQSQQMTLAHTLIKLKCQQCNHLFAAKPELLFYKGRMLLFCGKTCSDEYKRENKVMALCDYCKLPKIIKETVRFSGVDKPFCSEVCKFLFARDFGERWGNYYCKMCSYCSQTSANVVENRLEGKLEVFCCEECLTRFTVLFYQMAKCDGCKRQGKLSESIKWRGNIKHFCNLFCVLKFCHQYSMNDSLPQKRVLLPKPAPEIIPKAQTLMALPSARTASTPVITSVVSLAKLPAAQPTGDTNSVLKGIAPKEAAKIMEDNAQAAPVKFQASQPLKLLKNKGVLCKPVTQNKATSCKPCMQHIGCQTDLPGCSANCDAEPTSPPAKKKRAGFFQTYHMEYLQFGFIICPGSIESSPRPQCVICGEILPSESMTPASLSHHLKTKHSELENKPVEFFEQKSVEVQCENSSLKKCLLVEKSLVKASYLIAFQIAARKKPFAIAEELIKPYLVEMCSEVLGSSAGDKMKTIPLSNNTIGCRIDRLSADIEDQLIQKVRESKWFALQIDESSEISTLTLLLCYIRFIDYDCSDIKEELLFCIEMPSQVTDFEIFELINKYIDSKSLNWNHCVGFCTDGAASLTGRWSRLRSKIQEIAKNTVTFTHCFIHREHLAGKNLSPCLHEILLQSAQIISFVKSNASNSRMLTILCEEMGSEHVNLPLNAEVRWLSRGRILTRLFELRHEIEIFLNQKHSDLARYFHNDEWVAKLAYLADIFSLINKLNSSLQGTMTTFFSLYSKIDVFKTKLKMWLKRTQKNDYDMFPSFSEFSSSSDLNVKNITSVIFEHLEGLSQMFHYCYPAEDDLRSGNLWVISPFADHQNNNLSHSEEEKLVELSSELELQSAFKSMSVTQFWIHAKTSYPELHEKAMKVLLPFSTVYLCDAAFSALTESKQRNLLIFGPALRLAVTSLIPRIEKLVKEKE
uniref:zinc finger MYM-type protein 6 isoform X2 n=1 Tax=Jaculus jaculus TaxID=51337 RepID=UPI001E1B1B44|nr:zinc finger MYM-type protein 6 isoform X2 [Jaculus jaculus]